MAPRQDAAGQRSSLRQQYSGSVQGVAENISTCSFSDSEAGLSSEGLASQIRHAQLQQVQEQHAHIAAAPPLPAHAQQLLQDNQQQQQRQSFKKQASQRVADSQAPKPQSGPARVIRPHLSRPDVSRGIVHHVAKAFGIHLKGDVATNEISTAKYTMLTFLPVNLFEQFLRVANMYFLLMVILQLIPGLSPTSLFTTVAPLVFVLAVNAIKEGYDDVQRHRNDNQINNRLVILLSRGGERSVFWKDVVAGDLIKVRADEEVPADLVMLSSPDKDHLCYVETANLDGETNLKIKYCWPGFTSRDEIHQFEPFVQTCQVGCEPPNPKLYVFDGYMEVSDHARLAAHPRRRSSFDRWTGPTPRASETGPCPASRKEPLDINNLLLRGSVLRKTPWVIGMAINVGNDSKIVQNMTKAPRKVTQLERAMNVLVFVQFSALLVFSAVLAGLDQFWTTANIPGMWYLQSQNKWPELPPSGLGWLVAFLRFIILLSNMIPISLYVSLEVVKVFQCTLLLNPDREMYHEDSDTPFVCRTTTLNEELGQVQYVLSDKTGTLTQNVMGFVWASVSGKLYGRNVDADVAARPPGVPKKTPHTIALDAEMQQACGVAVGGKAASSADAAMHRFLLNLALCNTVVPTTGPDGQPVYQASSPDEEALVQGAAFLGYKLIERTTECIKVSVHGKEQKYDLLATLEFNSDRKRMSIVVQTPEKKVLLMCKGADSIILARLANSEHGVTKAEEHLDEMACGGYRTLMIADKELSMDEYEDWQAAFAAASVSLDDREAKMEVEQSRIETELRLVGATAVEDKLQDGVPDCLKDLSAAGIRVWVLTGDKVETAISIAYSCHLFTGDMRMVELREAYLSADLDDAAVRERLAEKLREVRFHNNEMHCLSGHTNVGIVIEGGALNAALSPDNQDALMALCKECKAVVCCRVTPMQKAQITLMVKKKAGAITLGIGDGANDVGMIRAAHIGVGISGREGRAAVLASDFSFAQFRYLSRLLLLHGRCSYMRNKEVVLYSFYKNWAYVLVYVYLQFEAGYSAIPIFTTMMISTFNMIFTACPIVAYAVLEQDLSKKTVLKNPETYSLTRTATRARFFWDFFTYVFVVGTWHSLPAYFLPWYSLISPDRNGLHGDLSALGTAVFISLVLTVTLKLSLRTHCWSWITHLVYWLSVALLFPFVYVVSILWASNGLSGLADMSGVGYWLFRNATFWLTAFSGACAVALLPDIAVMMYRRYFFPTVATLLQEQELKEYIAGQVDPAQAKNEQANPFGHRQSDEKHRKGASPKTKLAGPSRMPCCGSPQSHRRSGVEMQVTAAGPGGAPEQGWHVEPRSRQQQQQQQQQADHQRAGVLQQQQQQRRRYRLQQQLPGVA